MAIDIKPLLRAGLVAQSGALAGYNLKVALKKRKKATDIAGLGFTNIVGTSLLHEQGKLIEGL